MTRLRTALLTAALAPLALPSLAHAAGFQIREQSAEGLGRAYSGEAVAASDASGIWFNPAQGVRLGTQATATLSAISLDATLEDTGSALTFANGTVAPVGGVAGEDPIPFTIIPALSGIYQVNDQLAVHVSTNVPFGLEVDYGEGYFGRYDSETSELITADVQVGTSYAVSPTTSVGASVHLQYVEADLATALPDPLGRGLSPDPATRVPDGRSVLEGNNYGIGFSVGVVQDLGTRTQVGVSYRSEVEHNVDGSVIVEGLTAPFNVANGRQEASTSITLPDSVRAGIAFQASDRLQVTGQVEWVGWSDFESLDVELQSGATTSTPFDYKDATNIGVGLDYRATDALTLRAGVSSDPTPTRDDERSTRVPDADRTWFTAGGSYEFGSGFKLDAGIAYIDAETVDVVSDSTAFAGQPFAVGVRTRGELQADAIVGSIGLTKRF